MRERQVRDCLARGEDTIPAIVGRLYAGLSPALVPAAALTVKAHLEHMIEAGRVTGDGKRYRLR
jgi:hypothetical protein